MNNKIKKLEYLEKGGKIFEDQRGKIVNYSLPEKINLVATITSKPNTLRSNHYHAVQQQKCLLVKGQYVSVYQGLSLTNAPKITHIINEGDLAVTEPQVAHTMVFTKESIFLNLPSEIKGSLNILNKPLAETFFLSILYFFNLNHG